MNRKYLMTATAFLAALALAAPVQAQARARGPSSAGAGRAVGGAAQRAPSQPPATLGRAVPRGSVPSRPPIGLGRPFVPYGRNYYRPGGNLGFYYGFGYPYWGYYGYGYPYYGGYGGYYGYPYYGGYGSYYSYPYYGGYGGYYGGGYYGGYGYNGAAYGGVRISEAPKDAQVVVDGYYVGLAGDFDGPLQHLNLDSGPHRIEIRAPGFETLAFDVNVLPGQTINYRAHMRPVQQ